MRSYLKTSDLPGIIDDLKEALGSSSTVKLTMQLNNLLIGLNSITSLTQNQISIKPAIVIA